MNLPACLILLLALSSTACQSAQQRLAIEWRFDSARAQEDLYEDADPLDGAALSVHSLPIQGADHKLGWELGLGEGKEMFAFTNGTYTLRQRQAWLGLRYTFLDGHWRPYLGAGAQYTRHDILLDYLGNGMEKRADDFGPYLEAGLLVRISKEWHAVLGYRETFGMQAQVDAADLDLDTAQTFVGVGFSF
ncbi:MAG: outer membrane beta-barrel protein [Planctomycetes bacterium]|nr:outer membrane beta-barrel protein [Planctomycetota bacterium]MCB9909698.1 outer membrane beta-barrel protein [Planctomycetota bacterium]MCB9911813.1 outer membrane beta-barrel protein [Planctomycetota bacterium]HPF14908.1 outer membrane beta-barrel protein [Planctomycetota bacterium]HRV81410.1 outer membrane beta-barrel protein [Planctomycetota bacterium]